MYRILRAEWPLRVNCDMGDWDRHSMKTTTALKKLDEMERLRFSLPNKRAISFQRRLIPECPRGVRRWPPATRLRSAWLAQF
jgi:hypothetical protein